MGALEVLLWALAVALIIYAVIVGFRRMAADEDDETEIFSGGGDR